MQVNTQIDRHGGWWIHNSYPQHIDTVNVKLPPYWASDPQVWFVQLEAYFFTWGITVQNTKFNHLVASLSPEIAT